MEHSPKILTRKEAFKIQQETTIKEVSEVLKSAGIKVPSNPTLQGLYTVLGTKEAMQKLPNWVELQAELEEVSGNQVLENNAQGLNEFFDDIEEEFKKN